MSSKRWLVFCLVLSFFLVGLQTQPQEEPVISAPLSGSAVQGSVTISGNTDLQNFQSAEVSFSYLGGSTRNWFLIQQLDQPVKGGPLAVWDTTTIADGNYALRLQVYLKNGQIAETTLPELRVRNYSAVETSPANNQKTVSVTHLSPSPVPLTATPRFTPTSLPPNPVQVLPDNLTASLGWGIGLTVAFFILLALYQAAHHRGN